ncbi:MAG: hypothetical protein RSB57_10830, partial [Hungatella sp.]
MKSKRERKFRVIFLNDVPVTDRLSAEIIIKMLLKIFSQTDKSCKDVSRMFFGGKKLIGNVGKDTINIVGLTESFQRYIFETQQKNYSREIQQFAKENKIACINNCIQIFRICECDNDNEKNEDFSNIDSQESFNSSINEPEDEKDKFTFDYDDEIENENNKSSFENED